jgi:signal transduction histidine kinase
MHQISATISARFDERLAERTRVARELHDALLQTLQGSKLVADDALAQSSDLDRMRRAMEQLSNWLEQAANEGRTALNSLRPSGPQKNDLAEAFQRAIDDCRRCSSMDTTLSVIGEIKQMHPIVRDDIYRIGFEAVRNSCAHSKGTRLQMILKYGQDLTVRIVDNGIGINQDVIGGGKLGHLGLQRMRDLASRIGAKLTIASSPAAGTDITLIVPGRFVFPTKDITKWKSIKSTFTRKRRNSELGEM